jgi:putative nucleotidyltransferase with HDIG domain
VAIIAAIRSEQRRQVELELISIALALTLLATLVLLVFFTTSSGLELPSLVLQNPIVRVLLLTLAVVLLIYVSDQSRRLRKQVARSMHDAEEARKALDSTVQWLTLSLQTASVLGSQGVEDGLLGVLTEASETYHADAAAVVGNDLGNVFTSDGVSQGEARRALMHIAITAAGNPKPLLIESLGIEAGQAIAVPLRVLGELRFVLCMWNKSGGFGQEQLDALGLMGRMIELAMEREELLGQTHSELEGTLNVLQYLVSDRRPNYSEHAKRVSELTDKVGRRLGMAARDRKALQLASKLHDVGFVTLPHDFPSLDEPLTHEQRILLQEHPRIGAEIAQVAHFDAGVQDAIAAHHERVDGSGYPRNLHGKAIPLAARILAACDVFDSVSNHPGNGLDRSVDAAVDELCLNTDVLYDGDVVNALLAEVGARPLSGTLAR